MVDKNFHLEIRNSSKHELIGLIEAYNIYIKELKRATNAPLITLEDLWKQLQTDKGEI